MSPHRTVLADPTGAAAITPAPLLPGRPCFPSDLRVLLVDPDTSDRAHATAALQSLGYTHLTPLATADAAAAALLMAPRSSHATTATSLPAEVPTSFDVILADASAALSHHEAGGSGLFAAAAAADVPIVLMGCGGVGHGRMLKALELGADDFLERPLSPLKLQNLWQHTVRRSLRRRVHRPSAPRAVAAATPSPLSLRSGRRGAPSSATAAASASALESRAGGNASPRPPSPSPLQLLLPPPSPLPPVDACGCACAAAGGICLGGCDDDAPAVPVDGLLAFGVVGDYDDDWIPNLDLPSEAAREVLSEAAAKAPPSLLGTPRAAGAEAAVPWSVVPQAAPAALALPPLALPRPLRRSNTLCSDASCGTGLPSSNPSAGGGDGDGSPLAHNGNTPTSAHCGPCSPPVPIGCAAQPPAPAGCAGPPPPTAAWACCAWPPFVAVHGAPSAGAPGCVWGLPMCSVISAPGLMPPPPTASRHAAMP